MHIHAQQTMRPLLFVYDRSYVNKSGHLLSFMVIYNFLWSQKFFRFFFLILMVICEIKWSYDFFFFFEVVIYNFLRSQNFFRFFPYSYGHLWNKVVIGVLFLWRSCLTYSGRKYIFLIKYVFLVKHRFWWLQTNI